MSTAPDTSAPGLSADDKIALRSLVEQYFYGVDHRDGAAVADCFAQNCFFQINVDPPRTMHGQAEVRATFSGGAVFASSNHAVSHHTILADGDRISGITYAVAHLVLLPESSRRIVVRGLRYDDDYAIEDGRWRIARRIHNPLWQYEATATPLGI